MSKSVKSGNTDETLSTLNIDETHHLKRDSERSVSSTNCDKSCFAEFSLLPIYYNNVRSIMNKHNMCMKIELSVYKVLVLTETWLKKMIPPALPEKIQCLPV